MSGSSSDLPFGFSSLNHFAVSAFSLLLYDSILCLDTEIDLVWRQPWSASKILYLLCRYFFTLLLLLAFIVHTRTGPPDMLCMAWQNLIMYIGPILAIMVPDAMILLRLDALYRSYTKIRSLTVIIYALQVTIVFTIGAINTATAEHRGTLSLTPSGHHEQLGCKMHLKHVSMTLSALAWLIGFSAQIYYFVITMARFLHTSKEIRMDRRIHFNSLYTMRRTIPTMYSLLRDGSIYFFGTVVNYVLSVSLILKSPEMELWILGFIMMMAINPLLASRLYLNMKMQGFNNGTRNQGHTITEYLDFVSAECVESSGYHRAERGTRITTRPGSPS